MLQGDTSAWPVNCIGVAVMMQQSVYQSNYVQNVAVETWGPAAESAPVSRVKEGVVSLPTAADASALFARFSKQWQRCDDKTLPLSDGVFGLKVKVTNVQVAASVLAATISIDLDLPSGSISMPAGRAIGVRGNCLIEVEVDFLHAPTPSLLPGSRDVNTSALDIAQIMRDKVTALS